MKYVEFLGYKPTPNDKYSMLGVATTRMTVKIDDNRTGKFVVRYKHIRKKDGTSDFYAEGTVSIDEENVKLYFMDSTSDNDELKDFIRQKSKEQILASSAHNPVLFIQRQEVAVNDGLPF